MSERIMPYEFVTSDVRLQELLDEHQGEERYAFDTEFDNRRTYYPRLALVQIAWPDFIMLVDPFSVDVRLLAPLFASDATAIAHAASNDLAVLDRYLSVRPTRLFDTQIAAQMVGMRGSSLAYLASELLSLELDKSEQTSDWTVRPLSSAAEIYATNDVAHLFDLADELFIDLTALGRVAAFDEECEATLSATSRELQPQRSWWNVSNRETVDPADELVLQYLAGTREELAEMLNVTRRYLVPDDVLLAMAKARPRTVDAVRSFIGRRVDEAHLPQFVDAVRTAESSDGSELERPFDDRGTDSRSLVSLLQALVWQTAQGMSLEPSFLASKNDLLARIDGRSSKLDRGWRHEAITAAIDGVIAGQLAVAWRDGQLQLVTVS